MILMDEWSKMSKRRGRAVKQLPYGGKNRTSKFDAAILFMSSIPTGGCQSQ